MKQACTAPRASSGSNTLRQPNRLSNSNDRSNTAALDCRDKPKLMVFAAADLLLLPHAD